MTPSIRRADEMLGPLMVPTIQVHPSLRCNLACRHCYSVSGPGQAPGLEIRYLLDAISDAAAMGYRVVSVSGGEPLLYDDLPELLSHAKSLGMGTAVTTNGFFSNTKRLTQISSHLDLLAISLDGPPELHNYMRGSRNAFGRLVAGLDHVKKLKVNFGFLHTVTRHTWEHLPWVAEFAAEHCARLLQVHPLELAGRAQTGMGDACTDEETLAKVYLLTAAISARYRDAFSTQLDLLHRDDLTQRPELGCASQYSSSEENACPAGHLSTMVVEADGTIVPISYGFARRFAICNVKTQHLAAAWLPFLRGRYVEFRQLCRSLFDDLSRPTGPPLFNWHELVVARSTLWTAGPVSRLQDTQFDLVESRNVPI